MKIGILTLPLHTNYGGILQAYALQTVLQKMGHEVVVITQDFDVKRPFFRQCLSCSFYVLRKYVLRNKSAEYVTPKMINEARHEREQYTASFINKYIHTYAVRHLDRDVPKEFDAFVVGSDQIWRKKYVESLYAVNIETAFLKFAEKESVKRIAYAPSFGTDEWEYSEEETKECARLLSLFDAVSVREDSAKTLCKEHLERFDAQHMIDPTLLLSKDNYIQLVENSLTPKSKGDLMCYVLDMNEEKYQLVERISKERGLKPFYANSQVNNTNLPNKMRIQPPLEKWLRGFMDAEFVVTDSFHACVFSIIFSKPFVVVGNEKRGMARFKSLLSMFSLEGNFICNAVEYNSSYSYGVDSKVKALLDEKRNQSRLFLQTSLEK